MGTTIAMFIHFPAFLTDLGATESTIGLVLGAGAIASLLLRGAVGRALDTIGRRPVIITGHIINIAAIALHLTVGSIGPVLILLAVARGAAEALLFTSLLAYSADVVPASRRTEGLALYGVSGQLPLAVGGILGDLILDRWGFTELFIVATIVGGLALLAATPLTDHRPSDIVPLRGGFWRAVRSPAVRPLWLVTMPFAIALTALLLFIRTYFDQLGFGSVGLFYSAYSTTAVGLRIFARGLPARLGHERVLSASILALAGSFVALATVSNLPLVVLAGVLGGIGHGLAFPILNSLVVTSAPPEDRGAFLSAFVAFFPLATVFGGPIIGKLIESFGYRAVFLAVAGLLVITPRLYFGLERRISASQAVVRSDRAA